MPPIGLDVGSESIKMLQISGSAGDLRVVAAQRVPIPDDVKGDPDKRVAFAGETVKAALRQKIFRGARIAAALPKELVHYKTHRLSPMRAEDVADAAKIDARDLFRFDPDSGTLSVSKIFDWYRRDFEQGHRGYDSLKSVFARHADELADAAAARASIRAGHFRLAFLPYDWRLNDVR